MIKTYLEKRLIELYFELTSKVKESKDLKIPKTGITEEQLKLICEGSKLEGAFSEIKKALEILK